MPNLSSLSPSIRPLCRTALVALSGLLLAAGCDPAEDETTGTGGGSTGDATQTTTETPTTTTGASETESTQDTEDTSADSTGGSDTDEASTGEEDTVGGDLVWTEVAGPCGGSETNALWFDDRETGFVGCGENADGEGLYTTLDGAQTFEDSIRFREVRINDIRRASDGVLYGAGIHQLDSYAVWTFDESGATLNSTSIYDASNSAFTSVNQGENIAVTADGQILIDSLTGTQAAYQPAGGEFEETDSLSEDVLSDPDAGAYQVSRIVAHDNRFYGVGSLINNPARVHLPSQLDGATYHFNTVELQPETRDGELQDMHVWDSQHIIVAGHDQSERFPLIYLVDGADPYSLESWEKIELLDSGLEFEGGINDLHVVGDTVIAAGEKFPTSQGGFLVRSDDGGRTWEDITPPGEPNTGALSRVWMFEDGEMVVAGGGGEMWIYAAE